MIPVYERHLVVVETQGLPHPSGDSGRGHETRDMSVRPIAIFVVGLFVLTSVVLLLMVGLFDYYAARQAKLDVPPSPLAIREPPPEPRLQVAPAKELEEMRAAEDAVLNSYGWIDREDGVVRIPIDRAMALLLQRGLPVRPQTREKD